MKQITKQSMIGEIMELDRGVIPILFRSGMACIGCSASVYETLEEAGMVHGMEVDALVNEINEYLRTVSD
ncbi:MAG: DUF1858 domain-containing protein [Clostridiales bacterium]|jgi:hybrid cluster-associated redox disulfide protein|nr:DUF1858 domain-containing protein [Clostridiales bacterium]